MSDINLIITVDEDGSLRALALDIEKQLSEAGKKSGKKAGSLYARAFKSAGGAITGAIGALATATAGAFATAGVVAGATLVKGIRQSARTESIEAQFRTLLQSGQQAQVLLQDLQQFGATTPFELSGLATATTQLLSFGTAQKDIIPTLQQLGDISAGVGANIEDLTIPFGRLVSTQKLTLVELDKFADRGAVTYADLAKKAGVSITNIRDEISKGRVPFQVFIDVLNESTAEGGKFFNSMQAQSNTLGGALSNLSDSFTLFSGNLGKIFRPIVTKAVLALSDAFSSLADSIKDVNLFDDLLIPITRFNDAIINKAIEPLEIFFNVARAVGRGVADFFKPVTDTLTIQINNFIDLAQRVATALGKTFDVAKVEIKSFFDEANQDDTSLFEGVLDDTTFSDKLRSQNEELRAGLAEQRDIFKQAEEALNNDRGTETEEQVTLLADKYASTFDVLGSVASSALDGVGQDFKDFNKNMEQSNKFVGAFVKKTGTAFQKGFAGAVGGAFADLGRALQAGDNALEAFGQSFLKAIGQVLVQQGTAFILEGTAYTFSANPVLKAKGPGLIGAGSAMAIFGGVLGASVSGKPSGGGGGGGTSAGSTQFQDPVTGEFVGQLEGQAEPNTVLNINVEGNVVDQDAFTRRLVEQIGDEGGKQGLVFNNFATV